MLTKGVLLSVGATVQRSVPGLTNKRPPRITSRCYAAKIATPKFKLRIEPKPTCPAKTTCYLQHPCNLTASKPLTLRARL